MKLFINLFLALILLPSSFAEVPQFIITPKQSSYKDFQFAVEFEKQKLMHNQFELYTVAISIVPGNRKKIVRDGYISIWNDGKFVYSSSLHKKTKDFLPITLKQKLTRRNIVLFTFDINPDYIEGSWFNYQIFRDDTKVEMNCVIYLKDFIEFPKESSLQKEKTDEQKQ